MITLQERIAVMTASEHNNLIERRVADDLSAGWELDETPTWNWQNFDYRIKPVSGPTLTPISDDDLFAILEEGWVKDIATGSVYSVQQVLVGDDYDRISSKIHELEYLNPNTKSWENWSNSGVKYAKWDWRNPAGDRHRYGEDLDDVVLDDDLDDD